jgi:hypothetical protein
LGDVWVFDTYFSTWTEIKNIPFKIQSNPQGKKIKKFFEPRMAHTACVLDQYVVLFGGLNKLTNLLVSNELFALSLDGNTNAILPLTPPQSAPVSKKSGSQENCSGNENIKMKLRGDKPKIESMSKEAMEA